MLSTPEEREREARPPPIFVLLSLRKNGALIQKPLLPFGRNLVAAKLSENALRLAFSRRMHTALVVEELLGKNPLQTEQTGKIKLCT